MAPSAWLFRERRPSEEGRDAEERPGAVGVGARVRRFCSVPCPRGSHFHPSLPALGQALCLKALHPAGPPVPASRKPPPAHPAPPAEL